MKALEIKKLVKTYGELEVLKEIDLEIESGDFFALLGHNGAGKTTIISIITNLVMKNSGTVKVNGINIDEDFALARTFIGVVPQEFNFDIFETVTNICRTQAGYYGINTHKADENIELYLKKLGLWEKRNSKAVTLSGGMKRRLMIARALIHEPKILILDEPTAGVDVELRASMWQFIQELNASGTTILLTTHYLEEVEALCKNVAIINKGKIVENTSVKKLLQSLDHETIILNCINNIQIIPDTLVNNYNAKIIEDNELEITISKKNSLNQLFQELTTNNIQISSFRNKTNRLEQLFINITK